MTPAPLQSSSPTSLGDAQALATGQAAGVAVAEADSVPPPTGDMPVGAPTRHARVAADGRVRSACPSPGQALPRVGGPAAPPHPH
jgi:hypothetical protein